MTSSTRDRLRDAHAWVASMSKLMGTPEVLDTLTTKTVNTVIERIPEVADVEGRPVLTEAALESITAFITRVAHDEPGTVDPPPAARDLTRSLARRGIDVSVLSRIYHIGMSIVWRDILAGVLATPMDDALRTAVLDFVWEHISLTMEYGVATLVEEYHEEVRRQSRGASARRIDTVHALLRDEPIDLDLAIERLSHNLRRHQLGLVIWCDPPRGDGEPAGDSTADHEALARALAGRIGCPPPLTVPAGPHAMWAWFATSPSPDVAVITSVAAGSPRLRVAVGVPAPGPSGFRSTHAEAARAQSVAVKSPGAPQVTHYRDVELVSLMSANPEAMRMLVARELGALAAGDEATARLRETLRVHLEAGSTGRAAEALNVHKNTILYRLRRIEELLGHRVDERRLPLELALRVVDTYGPQWPEPPE